MNPQMAEYIFRNGLKHRDNGQEDWLWNDNYISIDEAAEYLGIKTVTIRNWIKKEMVPAHKVGKLWKFKRSELDEWVKSGKSAIN